MSSTSPTAPSRPARPTAKLYRLTVSRYDRVAGVLISLLILLGLAVLMMLIIWLTNQVFKTEIMPPIEMEEIGDQEEDPIGPGDDIEPPPPLETDIEIEETDEILEAVEDALATRAAMLERRVAGTGTGKGGGGTGLGRKGAPRRWELRFKEGNTIDAYARQLDYFGIELGVLIPDNKVLYVSKLAQARPEIREGSRDDEKRYRFTWTQGSLEQADRTLLARANVEYQSSVIYKFLPPELYQKLRVMEAEYAGERKIRSTLFGIQSSGNDYEFYVMRQSYRD
ncbi:MAG TPA: hypothetical protein VJL29_04480 [Thermoguttaceae bacterium]|nr:hypothetical protein [Thermoguttaceae bacterium]